MAKQPLVAKGKVSLKDFDPEYNGGMVKEEARLQTQAYREKFSELQTKLYADGRYSILIVLQAMDAAGKDSTIKNIFTGLNPQGIEVTSFKAPSTEELAHDFLWRVHKAVPEKGKIGVFNRSHYEDVLVVRVNKLVPDAVWQARYDHINHFEALLRANNTTILKFFLHISKDEQKKRFEERLADPTKHWKFSTGDLAVRAQWDHYMQAYEDVFRQCSPKEAPWHIVPANDKWYRDYVIMKTIVETMEQLPLRFPPAEEGLDKIVVPD
jgi:PPK2 family polyphosphate:nucleotide phosphotransferase